ncbi:MAG: homoserine dehydrogenase [Chloroflexi bacterium]|nr:homoserine dehydrogenase [Chloroflexota bacterium]
MTTSQRESLGVGLLGVGVVGSAVARALLEGRTQQTVPGSHPLVLKQAVVRNLESERPVPRDLLSDDVASVVDNPDVDIVVELMGGEEPASSSIRAALKSGKHVITANKEAIAKNGDELIALAEANGVRLLYEAAVGGGIPIIGPLSSDLLANKIQSLRAIINGTTNYILTRMTAQGEAFDDVLADAQALGYAEADPTADVDGWDAMYKIAILARLAYGASVPLDSIHREGIRPVTASDIRNAATLGYTIKLIAVARLEEGGLLVRVHPALIPNSVPMAKVDGVLNVCEIEGDLVGPLWLQGRGAGPEATASAVLGDIIRVARAPKTINPPRKLSSPPALLEMSDYECQYYLRLVAKDQPGVLAEVAGILASRSISIDSVLQMDSNPEAGTADIVLTTHPAREREVQQAVEQISAVSSIEKFASLLRIEPYGDTPA